MAFKFIDLFAGIGGFRIALESHGGECVFSSEWDKNSQDTYERNYGHRPSGDITKIGESDIPNHDVLTAGFPCQAFSISGKQRGFDDSRGTLFYDVARIAKFHQPKVVFLENVKNLERHDGGNTLRVILSTLEEIGYRPFYKVLRSSDFGVPQARERIYIVAIRKDIYKVPYHFPIPIKSTKNVKSVLEECVPEELFIEREDVHITKTEDVIDSKRPKQIGYINKGGQGERIYSIYGSAITLSAYGGGAAAKTGAYKVGDRVRKLSPRECARLQGFPEQFIPHEKRNIAYKQFGDSVSVPVLAAIFSNVLEAYRQELGG